MRIGGSRIVYFNAYLGCRSSRQANATGYLIGSHYYGQAYDEFSFAL
jgi:hypothetical protein